MSNMTQPVGDSNTLFLSIIAGTMVEKSEEGVQGAKRRDYETSDGKTWTKWEIHHRNLVGRISWMEFKETDYGEQFTLTLSAWEDTAKIFIGTDSRYFSDFGKKLPNINLEKDIEINPYDFKATDGKQLRWMSIKQDGEKVADHYWDGKKTTNGMPSVSKEDAKGYDSDSWKVFFITIKKFLKKEIQKVVLPTIVEEVKDVTLEEAEAAFE